ncbi:hypothetical protein BDZ91DRAFT_763295 [Kalaharituber pfeilii]|nr:hypothetical protein BDZ91DRAFT_763295 [Kalaharituber pfeilii]
MNKSQVYHFLLRRRKVHPELQREARAKLRMRSSAAAEGTEGENAAADLERAERMEVDFEARMSTTQRDATKKQKRDPHSRLVRNEVKSDWQKRKGPGAGRDATAVGEATARLGEVVEHRKGAVSRGWGELEGRMRAWGSLLLGRAKMRLLREYEDW